MLTAVEDGIEHARDLTAQTVRSLDGAWQQLSRLALDIPDLVCPECGEPAHRGTPTDLTPTQRPPAALPRYRHGDGTQLCPVVGPRRLPAGPTACTRQPQHASSARSIGRPDPEGQH